jgi:hypothetical protein
LKSPTPFVGSTEYIFPALYPEGINARFGFSDKAINLILTKILNINLYDFYLLSQKQF